MKYYKTNEALQDGEDTFFSILVCTKDLERIINIDGKKMGYITQPNGGSVFISLVAEVTKEEYKEFRKKYKTLRAKGEVEGSYFVRD